MTAGGAPTLDQAHAALGAARAVLGTAIETARVRGPSIHDDQVFLYDLSHAAAGVSMAVAGLDYGTQGRDEARLATIFAGRVVADLAATLWTAAEQWGADPGALDGARAFATAALAPDHVAAGAQAPARSGLPDDLQLVADSFGRFADELIAPRAEPIHRRDADIPDDIIAGVAELGCFGLSIPEHYGGSATGTREDLLAMVIATEQLSRASLGAGGSLITRPEILARALEAGGTEDQKRRWLPLIASGERLCAVAVTEPDVGSDVAQVRTAARAVEDGWVLDGTKTWCTFAGRADTLMVLARTEADPDLGHRGLSVFIVEKPRDPGHAFRHERDGGFIEGRAIPTLGYRGMHSFEVVFSGWFVPGENLIGGEEGRGRGFYLQMAGFENGRLQTAARAVGLMQRAYELARDYAAERRVFGQSLDAYQLTRVKLGTMAAMIQISRQYAYGVARRMASGDAGLEAAMAKAFVCKAAEWVTREALQIHGGYGYAEEYEVSRLFVDARVLSIFEGADETLCLKLIARRLVDRGLG